MAIKLLGKKKMDTNIKITADLLYSKGFVRSDDRTDDTSLKEFLDDMFGRDGEFFHQSQPEVYIAPASIFGVKDKKYSVFVRTKNRRYTFGNS